MPRAARIVLPDVPLHVTQRGNNRAPIFHSPADWSLYATLLREAITRSGCAVHAYVLMTNHVHLLVSPRDATGIAAMMRWLGSTFVRYHNNRYGRTGTLWEGRFKSTPIGSGRYFFACSRYIELNPVRAGMVDHPERYPWSSYHSSALGKHDPLVTPHAAYAALGLTDAQRREEYAALFASHIDPGVVDRIRRATVRGRLPESALMRETVAGVPPVQAIMTAEPAWLEDRRWVT
jgi:putative transposase